MLGPAKAGWGQAVVQAQGRLLWDPGQTLAPQAPSQQQPRSPPYRRLADDPVKLAGGFGLLQLLRVLALSSVCGWVLDGGWGVCVWGGGGLHVTLLKNGHVVHHSLIG